MRGAQQQRQIGFGRRNLLDQADLLQIFRRDRERDGVPDGFVESVVGAVAEQERLIAVGEVVIDVAQLMMHGDEIVRGVVEAESSGGRPGRRSMCQALAWQTTSRSAGRVSMERCQKVSGSVSRPSEWKKPSPYCTTCFGGGLALLSESRRCRMTAGQRAARPGRRCCPTPAPTYCPADGRESCRRLRSATAPYF